MQWGLTQPKFCSLSLRTVLLNHVFKQVSSHHKMLIVGTLWKEILTSSFWPKSIFGSADLDVLLEKETFGEQEGLSLIFH